MELWKDINGYEGYYQVSSYGRVRGLTRKIYPRTGSKPYIVKGRIIKDGTSTGGYRMITLSKDGNNNIFRVHRLVAEAFIPNPLNKSTVNHKDECVTNNNVKNLEWMSQSENNNYGTRKYRQRHHPNVVGHKFNITKEKLYKDLAHLTYDEISNKYGVSRTTIISYAKSFNISKHSILGTSLRNKKKLDIEKQEIVDLLEYGFTTTKIASMYGVDPHTIIKYKKKFNILDKDTKSLDRNKLLELVDKGYNISQIARKFNVSRNKIKRFSNNNGIKLNIGK